MGSSKGDQSHLGPLTKGQVAVKSLVKATTSSLFLPKLKSTPLPYLPAQNCPGTYHGHHDLRLSLSKVLAPPELAARLCKPPQKCP